MIMKKTMLITAALGLSLGAAAQGNNTGMGGYDGDFQSVAERVTNLEKKNDIFNLYLNYAASYQAEHNSQTGEWTSKFANRQLRVEIKGHLTDRIFYRFRHRLNKAADAKSQDNFAKATDIMMVGYNVSDKFSVLGGKMGQIWGGYEFDENPMGIYQYSDFNDNIDEFQAGVVLSYKPVPSQEIAVEVSNSNNGSFNDEIGQGATLMTAYTPITGKETLEKANHPLTYIANWNGSFLDGRIGTRWAWGIQTQAKHKYRRLLTLGQQLKLSRLQWYVDYMGAWEDVDRLGIATRELAPGCYGDDVGSPDFLGKVHYNSFITKMNWQFAPSWNLMLKGMYETASVSRVENWKNYRKAWGYIGSLEYYPAKQQDFRVFLAYIGRRYDYKASCRLNNYHTDRLELGFMYRIKAY